jgi:tripartite-type tricarboxylate transporter receptor subunit TctC
MIERLRHAQRVLCLAALVSLAAIGGAAAQTYPSHPVRWIIGFPPAGPTDVLVRIMADFLSNRLGQPVIVENKPGAASSIATEAVINASPDGYTIGSVTSANAINATVNKRTLQFDYLKQLIPVSGMSQGPSVLVVNPSLPAKTVAELVALAKSKPGELSYASGGTGAAHHIYMELLKSMTGIDVKHIPYRGGGPALGDVVAGHVPMMFGDVGPVTGLLRDGRVKGLGVTLGKRVETMP